MKITEEQKKALEEERIVPIKIHVNLAQCNFNPGVLGGEEDAGDSSTDRAGRD